MGRSYQKSINIRIIPFSLEEGGLVTSEILESDNESTWTCCFPEGKTNDGLTRINMDDIIWCKKAGAKNDGGNLYDIDYVETDKDKVELKQVRGLIKIKSSEYRRLDSENDLSEEILKKAYLEGKYRKSILVLINPFGGRGNAKEIYTKMVYPILKAANVAVTYKETEYRGHAIEIAKSLDCDKYDIVACCSGDGIPHEVINGFYQRPDRGIKAFSKVAIAQLPCGSGNALALSTFGTNRSDVATISMLKAKRAKMDLMAVTQFKGSEQITQLSFLSQSYGIIAEADLLTEHLRWLGSSRFDIGVAQRILKRETYPCDIYVKLATKSKEELLHHYCQHYNGAKELDAAVEISHVPDFPLNKSVTSDWVRLPDEIASNVMVCFVGKLPYISEGVQFFPAALPADGSMDMVIATNELSIFELIKVFLTVEKGTHVHDDKIHHYKVYGYKLIPKLPKNRTSCLSVDGENFPFVPYQVEILPSLLTFLLHDNKFTETHFSGLL